MNLDTEYTYENRSDAVTGEVLETGKPVSLERYSGRWIRCEKRGMNYKAIKPYEPSYKAPFEEHVDCIILSFYA